MYKHLYSEIEKMSGRHILCVGDIMLDRFIYGNVGRISPEAPIPVFHEQRIETTLGGAGNVVRNIISLGGNADAIGLVGEDAAGYELTEKIAEDESVTPYILTDETRPTIIKTRFVSGGQQLLRSDREKACMIDEAMEEQVLLRVRGAIDSCDVVILSDYAKGLLTDRVISEIVKLCRDKNKPLFIDTKGRDFSRYKGAFMLTPNRKELKEATGMTINDNEDTEKAARFLIQEYELDGVLAKMSGEGVLLVMKDKPAEHYKADTREVYDVSGAGDTVVATMALGMASGLSLSDSAALSNLAGSVVVGKTGTATISQDELRTEIMHGQARFSEGKVISPDEAAEIAKHCRNKGLKVGFTNGIFDIMQPGHLSAVRQARAACDFLIVGLNSDKSASKNKNGKPPIHNEEARATVLAALPNVNAVVIFNNETPYDLIKTIRPDVLAKGDEYKKEEVVGYDLIESWGGEVVLTKRIEPIVPNGGIRHSE